MQDLVGSEVSPVLLCPSYQSSWWNSHSNTATMHLIHIDPELVGHAVWLEKEPSHTH